MTAKTPQALSDKYLGGSKEATHGTDFAMLFHYSADDHKGYKKTKTDFRQVIKDFIYNGTISDWQQFPTTYNISTNKVEPTSRWTISDCEKWRSFYPDYSWMN